MLRRCLQVAAFLLLLATTVAPLAAEEKAKSAKRLPQVEPAEVGMEAATLAQIPEKMRRFVEEGQIAGAVTLVARDGKIVHHTAVGHADIAEDRPMRKNTIFAIASMTKPITATAVLILRDEGKLSLDDPVSKYIPEFKDATLNGELPEQPITLRHVLTHTSGLTGSQQNEGTLENTAKALAQRPLSFAPGEKWSYSPGLTVAGRVVEVASGMPYEQFLQERIFRPLRMKNTTFHPNEKQQQRLARLYKPGQEKNSLEATSHWLSDLSDDRTPNPSGGLFSTARDMAQFYQMVLNGGELDGRRILSEKSVEEMTSIQTGDLATGFTPGNGWGLGWCVVREPQGVSRMLSPGSFGHGGAFGTQGWVDPKRKMIFVLMIQRTEFGNSDASAIREALQETAVAALSDAE